MLVVEDSVDDYDLLLRALRRAGHSPQAERVHTEADLRAALGGASWDIVLLDHVIPGYGGPEALRLTRELLPDMAAIVVSGKVDEDVIAADLRLGADDYVLKSHLSRLAPAIETAMQAAARRREQRRAAEQLRASEERLRQVLGAVAVAIWEIDCSGPKALLDRLMQQTDDPVAYVADHPDLAGEMIAAARLLDCNEWALRLFGATDREELFARLPETMTDSLLDRLGSEIRALLAGRDHTIGEVDLRTLGGESMRCLVSVAYPRPTESFERMVVAISQVGRPWQADDALRESLERMQLALEGADLSFYDWDLASGELRVDDRYFELFGYERGAFEPSIGWWESRLHPDDHARVMEFTRRQLAGDARFADLEYRVRTRAGDWRWVVDRGHVVERSEKGEPLRFAGTFCDISARKRAQQALERARERLELALEGARLGFFEWDMAADGLDCDARYLTMLGYEVGEVDLSIEWWWSSVHPDDQDDLGRLVDDLQAGRQERWDRMLRQRHKDGHWVWALTRGRVVAWAADGTPTRAVGTHLDVSDLKAAEEALAASEDKHRHMIEQANEGVWVIDAAERTTFVNRRLQEMFGYEEQEMIGRPVGDFLFPEDLSEHRKAMTARRAGQSARYERRFRRKDGSEVWTIVAARPLLEADGSFTGSFGMFTDITERVHAEREMAAHRDLLSAVFESAPYVVLVLDAECRVREVNRAAEEFLGSSEDTLTGLLCGDALGCAHAATAVCGTGSECAACTVRTLTERAIAGGGPARDVEGRLTLRRDGALADADVLVSAAPVVAHGETLCLVTIADVTERARALRAVAESEARYRRVVEGTSEGLLELDADYRVVTANDRWLAMMGYEREAVVGRPVHDYLFPEDLPDLQANIERRRRGIAGRHERRFRRADGGELWAVISAVPRIADDGSFEGVVALWLDITEEKRTARTLAARESYYRTVLQSLHEDVLVIGADYGVTDINDSALRSLGTRREDVLGRPCYKVWRSFDSPCDDRAETCPLKDVLTTGVSANFRFAGASADGAPLHLDVLMAPLHDEHGEVTHVVEAARDVTELYVAQESLAEHAERLRHTVEGAVDAMGSVVEMRDPYTAGHERRVTLLAVEIGRRLGLDEQRLEGLRLAGTVHDIGKIAVPAEILSKPGRLQEYEMSLVRTHAQVGHDVLAPIDFEQPVADIVLQHHEKLDGSGYPQGLRGEQILPEARILTVADVVEAMSSHRPYRAALGMEVALAEIRSGAGTIYDADAVAACEQAVADGFTFEDRT